MVGDDITQNVEPFVHPRIASAAPEFSKCGEVYMDKRGFEKLNKERRSGFAAFPIREMPPPRTSIWTRYRRGPSVSFTAPARWKMSLRSIPLFLFSELGLPHASVGGWLIRLRKS
jgi:hypothetical protein